jgi:hypothetical protein
MRNLISIDLMRTLNADAMRRAMRAEDGRVPFNLASYRAAVATQLRACPTCGEDLDNFGACPAGHRSDRW